jgi:hypothetical protein
VTDSPEVSFVGGCAVLFTNRILQGGRVEEDGMGQGVITVLNPTGRAVSREFRRAPRLVDLNGKVLGLLWNGKPNGDILLRRIQESLARSFKLSGVIWRKKPAVDVPAKEILRELALEADFIINGQGD